MGQLRISELRDKATRQLGELFDLKDFHEVVLDSFGPMSLLEEEVDNYINQVLQIWFFLESIFFFSIFFISHEFIRHSVVKKNSMQNESFDTSFCVFNLY